MKYSAICTNACFRRGSIRATRRCRQFCEVVNAFYAEKTRQVLEQMQAVLSKIET
jgi:hypothetical protein